MNKKKTPLGSNKQQQPPTALDAGFRVLLDAAPTPFLVLEPTRFTIIAANNAYRRTIMTGRKGLIGRSLFDVFPDHSAAPDATGTHTLAASLIRVLYTRQTDTMGAQCYPIRGSDGSIQTCWRRPVNVPVLNADGEIECILHRVETMPQASEAHYQLLFDSIDEAFCIIEVLFEADSPVDYRFLETNAAFEYQTGLTDAIGRRMRELAPHHEQHWFDIFGRIARTGEPERFEHRADALGHWYEVYAFRIGEPKQRQVAVLFKDIRARKQTEQALRESEKRLTDDLAGMHRLYALHAKLASASELKNALEEIIQTANEFLDTDRGCVQLVSEDGERLAMYAYIGYDPEDSFIQHFTQQGSALAGAVVRREQQRLVIEDMANYEPLKDTMDWQVRLDSGIRAAQATPLIGRDGRLLGILSNQFRVPHRPADDQFKRIDLLAWSAAQAIERHQTDAALRCSDQRKDEFMATLAHELRNPLAPLRDSLNILQRGPHDDDDRLLSIMARQLKHMERLVDDLLDISRIAHGHIELKREPLDLNDAVCDAVETTRPLVASKRHHLYVALADAALPVHGDPTRLGQIFTNLINNSVHYMAAGGNIWVSSARRDGQAQVSVRDTGQGLTQEQLPAMFELFTQGEHSHLEEASSGRGLGIGLALVQKLTMLHGGEVIADSAGADQGSTFTVTLPLAAGGIQPAATPPATPARPLPEDLSVLVVDDYKDGADGLAMLLELEDIQVHTVYSAAAALQALQENQFTVALIDIGMPEMNGLELAEHIRAQSEFDALQLIALTGWGQEADIERSRQAGFDHHIIKPPDLETLLPLLSGRAD